MKISVKIIEDNLFKNLFTNGEELYWPAIFNSLYIPFLKTGVTLASFHISGYVEVDKILVKRIL